jgi:next-to-BRCA1 protein 1
MPRPATVEDEVDASAEQQEARRFPSSSDSLPTLEQLPITKETSTSSSVAEIQRGIENLLSRATSNLAQDSLSSPTNAGESSSGSEIPVTRGAAARDKWFAGLACVNLERQAALRNKIGPPIVPVASTYSVYCNKCNHPIPDEHYHCSTCDDGDFDLCQDCVAAGELCGGESHWMIKRFVKNGKVINSTTETIAPRTTYSESKTTLVAVEDTKDEVAASRTCNSCIQEFPEDSFVTCTSCDDFDLCIPCHVGLLHGHNPRHAFTPAVEDMTLDPLAKALLQPGRNTSHHAICDGCDKYIYGVRHKCLDCPDWDYCSDCIPNSTFIHPRHRFVPIYEPISEIHLQNYFTKVRHHGIYCDGPLCSSKSSHIVGDRFKCAVCHDTDFCGSCEASPSNLHNKTHPLIKFKTPVRNVSVTTMGDHDNGAPLPVMGDRRRRCTRSTATATTSSSNAATQVQTVADLKPTEPVKAEEPEPYVEEAKPVEAKTPIEEELIAHFVCDSVPDGSVLPTGCVFEQTWTLRNGGTKSWPAGCTVKFVGGDNMCAVDPEHPASVHELVSAAESTTCYSEVAPGQEFGFTVLMRTPQRAGKVISYWRLTGPTGNKFGHRLWCDITVEDSTPVVKEELNEEKDQEIKGQFTEEEKSVEHSQMIFPKLDKESPATSVHQDIAATKQPETDDFEDFVDEELEDDETEDGFLTDEEYDILDASDEEYLAEQEKAAKK